MKKLLVWGFAGVPLLALLGLASAIYLAQRADYGWSPRLAAPTFRTSHPQVVIDEAHNNSSTAGIGGRYWPLARLLRADGYAVRRGTDSFTATSLEGVQVLVIANASGAPKPQFMGINIPVSTSKQRGDPAFTAEEIAAVVRWVEAGGGLLLIADHAPFGAASQALAAAFHVRMHAGFLEVPGEPSDPLVFAQDRLGNHPILSGNGGKTAVRRVLTFTGQSLDGPPEATVLLRVPEKAIEYVVGDRGGLQPSPAGKAQALALPWGKGRVAVLGEAAMLTAQVDRGKPFGMNLPENDNQQFALNLLHWLCQTP